MEQEPIDVALARPAPGGRRTGMPLWLQLLVSILVIVVGVGVAVVFVPGTAATLERYGISLPLPAAVTADAAPQAGTQPGGRPGAAGNFGGRAGGRAAAVVVVAPVTSAVINNKLTAIGEGSAIRAVTVTAAANGTLDRLLVKPGDRVEAGAILAELDSQSQQNGYDRASLASTAATTALERANQLKVANSIPAVQLEAAQLAADNANLALRDAEIALQQRTILAPVSGIVGLFQVTPGNQVTAQTIVTTVEDSSEILVNFWVPERYATSISVGMPVAAESVALPGVGFNGIVSAVDNRIDAASRTLQVQATLPNADGRIRAGMSFSVAMKFPGESFAAVDPLAIQWSSDGAYVWKYADGTIAKGMVEIIQRNTDGVLVKGDIAPGDEVVTQGVLQLQDGATARLLDAPAATTGQTGATPAAQQGQPPVAGTTGAASPAQTPGQEGQPQRQQRQGGGRNGATQNSGS